MTIGGKLAAVVSEQRWGLYAAAVWASRRGGASG